MKKYLKFLISKIPIIILFVIILGYYADYNNKKMIEDLDREFYTVSLNSIKQKYDSLKNIDNIKFCFFGNNELRTFSKGTFFNIKVKVDTKKSRCYFRLKGIIKDEKTSFNSVKLIKCK